MTRQLVDVMAESVTDDLHDSFPDRFVASLLTEPAEHTIDCPTCGGKGEWQRWGKWVPCPEDCTNGRQTIEVIARVVKR